MYRYDKYGNCIYYDFYIGAVEYGEDVECEYVPTEENYQPVVNAAVSRLKEIVGYPT